MSVSTLFGVVRFDTGEGRMRVIIEAPQQLVLYFCGEYIDRDVTTNILLGGG